MVTLNVPRQCHGGLDKKRRVYENEPGSLSIFLEVSLSMALRRCQKEPSSTLPERDRHSPRHASTMAPLGQMCHHAALDENKCLAQCHFRFAPATRVKLCQCKTPQGAVDAHCSHISPCSAGTAA